MFELELELIYHPMTICQETKEMHKPTLSKKSNNGNNWIC
jgi:hypothetical protein